MSAWVQHAFNTVALHFVTIVNLFGVMLTRNRLFDGARIWNRVSSHLACHPDLDIPLYHPAIAWPVVPLTPVVLTLHAAESWLPIKGCPLAIVTSTNGIRWVSRVVLRSSAA